jgi:hypothetical protein
MCARPVTLLARNDTEGALRVLLGVRGRTEGREKTGGVPFWGGDSRTFARISVLLPFTFRVKLYPFVKIGF